MSTDIKARVKEVLENTITVSLGTVDEGGVWVAVVHFVSDDNFNIYWMSSPAVRHSVAITKNPQVAGTITINPKADTPNLGIQFSGQAEQLESLDRDLVVKYFAKSNKEAPPEDEPLKGRSWYKITPTKIELIDQANFGYQKQAVEL